MRQPCKPACSRQAGITLIELLVALLVFGIVSAAAFQLYAQHIRVYSQQQDLAALNLNLRNALTMIQMDLNNAGTGVFVGANVPSWPIGVTIQNNPAGYDTFHIVTSVAGVPPVHPTNIGTNCVSTTSSVLFVNPPPAMTVAQTAGLFKRGDQILLVKADGSQMTSVVLTQDGQPSGNKIQLQHNPTGANGTAGDPLFITNNPNNKLGTTFCDNDWVIKLRPISYRVNASNPDNPVLERVESGVAAAVADQIVSFKVGATLWNGSTTSSAEYNYDSSTFGCSNPPVPPCGYDFTLIRSVRVSILGRTRPNTEPTYTYRNLFDGGPYQILGASVVVNPRNLSMKD
jgi:prepilin-type N-terminal cleavage/methylation domain-containing protein